MDRCLQSDIKQYTIKSKASRSHKLKKRCVLKHVKTLMLISTSGGWGGGGSTEK